MSYRGDGGIVIEIRLREGRPAREQVGQAAGILRPEPREVVVAELIHRDQQHELDLGRPTGPPLGARRLRQRQGQREQSGGKD